MSFYRTPTSGLTALAALSGLGAVNTGLYAAPVPVAQPSRWIYVERRFDEFIENIGMLQTRLDDGMTKQAGIRACLNRAYWSSNSETENSYLVGSWGKQTRVRPSGDIDLFFILPNEVWQRFEARLGNKQSQLLQEVRAVIGNTYSGTDIRGDGQVVVVPFATIPVEVVPAFRCGDGRLIICDTNDNGRYKYADPLAEIAALEAADTAYNKNARTLTRLMKKWQQNCDVPIKAYQLERLMIDFLGTSAYNQNGRFWYDWLVRDFLAYLIGKENAYVCMPGTNEWIALGSEWVPAAKRAYAAALIACAHEDANRETAAGDKWQEIFGGAIPREVQR